jgi:hypothetical protein
MGMYERGTSSGRHTNTYKGKKVGAVGPAICIVTATVAVTLVFCTIIEKVHKGSRHTTGYSDEEIDVESLTDPGSRVTMKERRKLLSGLLGMPNIELNIWYKLFVFQVHKVCLHFSFLFPIYVVLLHLLPIKRWAWKETKYQRLAYH